MASGFFKRTMVYLGLVDDDYDDEDAEPTRAMARVSSHYDEEEERVPVTSSAVRVRDDTGAAAAGTVRLRPLAPVEPEISARVHVVAPMEFADARQIADRLLGSQPVIINMQAADRELMRRMIDFCSGVTYALQGKMERVADKVFLVTPSNVKVSAEERQRLQENGLLQP